MLLCIGQESPIGEMELPFIASSSGKKCLMGYGPIDLDTIGLVRHTRNGANLWEFSG